MNEPLAGRQIRVGDDETARFEIDTESSNGALPAAGHLDRDIAPGRDLPRGPARAIELSGTEVLDPLEGLSDDQVRGGDNYVSVMDENLRKLREALGCR